MRISDGNARAHVAIPKSKPWRSEAYRRRVAELPCAHCHKPGPSQAAHADQGKGMGMKAGDETCYPLCADGPAWRGCHTRIGAGGLYGKEERRALEAEYAAKTRKALEAE